MKGYVVNLKKRPDRLVRFQEEVAKHLPSIDIEVVEAVDGSLLDVQDPELKRRVNTWNYANLNGRLLSGVIGCCLSHLDILQKIIDGEEEHVIIFEDDCCFMKGQEVNADQRVQQLMRTLPSQYGIIALNDWAFGPWTKNVKAADDGIHPDLLKIMQGAKTTESYVINKAFAKLLYERNVNNIGAIDAHIEQTLLENLQFPAYCWKENTMFCQYDRKDSNIR